MGQTVQLDALPKGNPRIENVKIFLAVALQEAIAFALEKLTPE
jgi:hypothetical protein